MKRLSILFLLCGLLFSCASAEGISTSPQSRVPSLTVSDCSFAIALTDGVHRIEQGGAYHVYGQATGQLMVNAKGSDVILLLDNVALSSSDGPAIYVQAARRVVIFVPEGTRSVLRDSPTYTLPENEDEPNAAIFSKADLLIGGQGELTVVGQYEDGIAGKDSLIIESNLVVTAVDDAVRGKDSVTVTGSALSLNAGGDGIKSTNENGDEVGFVLLHDSETTVVCGADGVQAASSVTMDNGTLTITSGGGCDEAHRQQLTPPISARDRENGVIGQMEDELTDGETTGNSSKGVKARAIRISGGQLSVSARDDALHAGKSILLEGGNLMLMSNDDAIHSDDTLVISGGEVSVTDSYEGFEAAHIEVGGGVTSVKAIDDGWNAASKTVTEAAGERKTYDFSLVISGGRHRVIAGGDALDSNGNILVSGGVTLAATGNTQKEVPLDYPMNCVCRITGGTVLIAGPYGKQIQTFNRVENQACLLVKWGKAQTANTQIVLQDERGVSVLSYCVPTAFQAAILSSPDIQVGGAYNVMTGETISKAKTVTEASVFFPLSTQVKTAKRSDTAPKPAKTPKLAGLSDSTTPTSARGKGTELSYGLYIPENAEKETLPLIVCLHGGSGKGDDISKVESGGLPAMVLNGQLGDVRAYVLYPQCPEEEKGWNRLADKVAALIEQILRQYPIDPDRVILTGHSMGGTGAWSLACEIPQYFSCVIPMSGSVTMTNEKTAALSAFPVWAFAAANDKVVKAESTVAAMEQLQKLSPANRVTIFNEGEHRDVPALAWLDEDIGLLAWAISQQRQP